MSETSPTPKFYNCAAFQADMARFRAPIDESLAGQAGLEFSCDYELPTGLTCPYLARVAASGEVSAFDPTSGEERVCPIDAITQDRGANILDALIAASDAAAGRPGLRIDPDKPSRYPDGCAIARESGMAPSEPLFDDLVGQLPDSAGQYDDALKEAGLHEPTATSNLQACGSCVLRMHDLTVVAAGLAKPHNPELQAEITARVHPGCAWHEIRDRPQPGSM